MPELPETSALLQVHPACVSVDKKRDAKYLRGTGSPQLPGL